MMNNSGPQIIPANRRSEANVKSIINGAGSDVLAAFETETGRDVSDDGDKLDLIESGATADQTDAEIIAAMSPLTNPLALSQGINLTAASSGSNGIQVASNDDINFGTGDFTVHYIGKLADWHQIAAQSLIQLNRLLLSTDTNGILYGSGKASKINTIQDGSFSQITVVTVRETATLAGSVTFYVDGNLFDSVVIPAGVPADWDTSEPLYINGSSISRTASTIQAAYIYNYALDADQVADLYKNGVAMADRDGSMTSFITGDNSDFASSLGDWSANNTWGSQTNPATNMVLAASASDQYTYLLVPELTDGVCYNMSFSASVVIGTPRITFYSGAHVTVAYIADGINNVKFTFFGNTKNIYILAGTASDALTLDNIVLYKSGATLRLEPENIQLSPGQWLDSANNHHAKLPAEGATLIRPQSDGEIKWTNTWAASSAGQYIGGINEDIFSSDNIRIEYISIQTDTTGVYIIIGDQTDTDRYVESVALTEELDISSPAHRNHDGTNLKVVITPSGTYTGSITTTIKYKRIG